MSPVSSWPLLGVPHWTPYFAPVVPSTLGTLLASHLISRFIKLDYYTYHSTIQAHAISLPGLSLTRSLCFHSFDSIMKDLAIRKSRQASSGHIRLFAIWSCPATSPSHWHTVSCKGTFKYHGAPFWNPNQNSRFSLLVSSFYFYQYYWYSNFPFIQSFLDSIERAHFAMPASPYPHI